MLKKKGSGGDGYTKQKTAYLDKKQDLSVFYLLFCAFFLFIYQNGGCSRQ